MKDPGELTALEAHLRAHPDDWPSWLVYADWLTDRGDSRGRLIVLEHRLVLGASSGSLSEEQRRALRDEIEALVETHREEWLQGWQRSDQMEPEWRHGFVHWLRFRQAAGAVEALESLVARPAGKLLARLSFEEGALGPEGAARLARCPALATVVALDFLGNDLGDEGVIALARSEHLGALTMLRLSRERIGLDGARALARAEGLRGLTALDLSSNNLDFEAAAALVRSETLRSLAVLILTGNRIHKEGRARLARSRCAIEW